VQRSRGAFALAAEPAEAHFEEWLELGDRSKGTRGVLAARQQIVRLDAIHCQPLCKEVVVCKGNLLPPSFKTSPPARQALAGQPPSSPIA
jgi:hypothetical protein